MFHLGSEWPFGRIRAAEEVLGLNHHPLDCELLCHWMLAREGAHQSPLTETLHPSLLPCAIRHLLLHHGAAGLWRRARSAARELCQTLRSVATVTAPRAPGSPTLDIEEGFQIERCLRLIVGDCLDPPSVADEP